MGYQTDFKLRTVKADGRSVAMPAIDNLGGYSGWVDEGTGWVPTCISLDEVKWYEHETDMQNLSKQYPDLVWVLDGEGEDQSDVWRKFFYRGAMWTWRRPSPEPPDLNPYILNDLLNDKEST